MAKKLNLVVQYGKDLEMIFEMLLEHMNNQLTVDFKAVSHARFHWKNQYGMTLRCKPRRPTVHGKEVPNEIAPYIQGYENETMLMRAVRRNLLDKWQAQCILYLRNNHSLMFVGDKAQQMFDAYNAHIYK